MAKKPRLVFNLICDDVRQEIGNKLTYVGVYGPSPTIFVSKLPFTFPKLCFVMGFTGLKKGTAFSIHIEDSGGKSILESAKGLVPESPEEKVTLFAVFSPLLIKEEGYYKAHITFDEDENTIQEFVFYVKQTEKT